MAEVELIKLQKHLALLREEYVKLQNKHGELEKKYNLLISIANHNNQSSSLNPNDNFINRLLKTISELFDKDLYYDLKIKLANEQHLKAHKFVLDARSKNWDSQDLSTINELDLSDIDYDIGYNLIKWIYTDTIQSSIKLDENFYLEMMKQAVRFSLNELKLKCEEGLLAFIDVTNCIRFYEIAEKLSATTLKAYCNELINFHWDNFTSEDFAFISASLLFQMFKNKTNYVLHSSIRYKREDIVFLYLIENDSILQQKLNEEDEKGDLPLDIALHTKQESIAKVLVKNYADLNKTDINGHSLLHKVILRDDVYSGIFLIENNINVNLQSFIEKKTALMLLASIKDLSAEMLNLSKKILKSNSVDINLQDNDGNTALHISVSSKNKHLFKEILLNTNSKPNLNIKNKKGNTVLWLALLHSEEIDDFYQPESFSNLLISSGCELNICDSHNNSILHLCALNYLEKSAIFLVNKGAIINIMNEDGESVLHLACENGMKNLVQILLEKGANPNVQTSKATNSLSPLHKLILNNNQDLLSIFINIRRQSLERNNDCFTLVAPDFNIKDADGQSALSLCLWNGSINYAKQLIDSGADVNITDNEGIPLLHQAILRQCTEAALFLLDQNIDINIRCLHNNLTALQLAVKRHLPLVVEALCKRGADMSVLDSEGNSPLWNALDSGQEDIASILVTNQCDTTQWGVGPENCQQTLLHRAIDENNDAIAIFLIKSGCDINSPRRPGLHGELPDEAIDKMSPIHISCAWGQEKIVSALLQYGCEINIQDSEGNTPLHVAILNHHTEIIKILLKHPKIDLNLKNNVGQTPFATALIQKNNNATNLIVKREPNAAEQTDNKGRNFLINAVLNSDIETVLSLISVNVNINSRVQDNLAKTALHFAVEVGSEIIIRNLILAGANVNDLMSNKKSSLHLVAESMSPSAATITSILLENGINVNALDSASNNALHIAVHNGNLPVVKILLLNSDIDIYAINSKGMSPLHVLSVYGRENSNLILDAFKENFNDINLDLKDTKGNSALLLAYQNGNGNLCRSLIKYGATIGTYNDDGVSIFNHPVATKQLIFKLLDILNKESPWVEAEFCLECSLKFSITNRKHHCRHCGRVLCKKCSEKEISILKFSLQKPVRVCDMCFDVLTAGSQNMIN